MFKGVEWHKRLIKVTETLPNTQVRFMRKQSGSQQILKLKQRYFSLKGRILCWILLPLFMGFQRCLLQRSGVKEKTDGLYCACAVQTLGWGRGQRFIYVRSRGRKVTLLIVLNINSKRKISVVNTCDILRNICNMCTGKKGDLILSNSLLTNNHGNIICR